MTNKRRYWALITPMAGGAFTEIVRQYETVGLEGVWAPQLWGPPFVALGAAATVTSRLKLGSGVALAFLRSPVETACAALDLDLLSGGRAVLGVGTSVRSINEDWHGVHYGKPIPHLREAVRVIRLIIAEGHTGRLGRFDGEYYKLNLEGFQTFAPPVRTEIPIYIPAVYETACRVAGELADGLPGHPIWCEQWIFERVAPNLKKWLDKARKERSRFDLNLFLFVAPGRERRQCIEDARRTIAFYAHFEQYERYFAACGFGRETRAIIEAYRRNDEAAGLAACHDAMVEKFALVGPIEDIRRAVDRIAEVTDSFTLCVPFYGLSAEQIGMYNQRIAEGFYH